MQSTRERHGLLGHGKGHEAGIRGTSWASCKLKKKVGKLWSSERCRSTFWIPAFFVAGQDECRSRTIAQRFVHHILNDKKNLRLECNVDSGRAAGCATRPCEIAIDRFGTTIFWTWHWPSEDARVATHARHLCSRGERDDECKHTRRDGLSLFLPHPSSAIREPVVILHPWRKIDDWARGRLAKKIF